VRPQQVSNENSLWASAYRDFQVANPELAAKFEHCMGITSVKNGENCYPEIKGLALKSLEEITQADNWKGKSSTPSAIMQKYFDQIIKIIIASKTFISSAISANPHAALAWAGISLLLPVCPFTVSIS
jgi:hypothetical protein